MPTGGRGPVVETTPAPHAHLPVEPVEVRRRAPHHRVRPDRVPVGQPPVARTRFGFVHHRHTWIAAAGDVPGLRLPLVTRSSTPDSKMASSRLRAASRAWVRAAPARRGDRSHSRSATSSASRYSALVGAGAPPTRRWRPARPGAARRARPGRSSAPAATLRCPRHGRARTRPLRGHHDAGDGRQRDQDTRSARPSWAVGVGARTPPAREPAVRSTPQSAGRHRSRWQGPTGRAASVRRWWPGTPR